MAQPEINTLTLEEIIPFNVAAKSKDWADLYFQTIKNHNRHAVEYLKSLNDILPK